MTEKFGRRNFLKLAATGAAGGAVAVLTACSSEKEASPTPTALYISTPTASDIPMPNPVIAPDIFTATPTAAPTETALILGERQLLEQDLANLGEAYQTHYLAWNNRLVDETSGTAVVDLVEFSNYFIARQELSASRPEVTRFDRMFAGLFQPVVDFRDRAPDFDKRNNGQGMGYKTEDLNTLRSIQDSVGLLARGETISRYNDQYERAWMIGSAHQADAAVLALVDNWLMVYHRVDPLSGEVQALRRQTFNRIIYGDLGVMPSGNSGDWWTVTGNGRFDIACSTYTNQADKRSEQEEQTRLLSFNPNQQPEKETVLNANDHVLVVGVIGPDGHLRVEVYTLSNAPDALNPAQDQPGTDGCSAAGLRWLPCGEKVPVSTATSESQETTPLSPTSVPTNIHIIHTKVPGTPVPNPQPTEIP